MHLQVHRSSPGPIWAINGMTMLEVGYVCPPPKENGKILLPALNLCVMLATEPVSVFCT